MDQIEGRMYIVNQEQRDELLKANPDVASQLEVWVLPKGKRPYISLKLSTGTSEIYYGKDAIKKLNDMRTNDGDGKVY